MAIGDNLESNILATVAAQDAKAKKGRTSKADEGCQDSQPHWCATGDPARKRDGRVRLARKLATPEVLDLLTFGEKYGVMEIDVNSHPCVAR